MTDIKTTDDTDAVALGQHQKGVSMWASVPKGLSHPPSLSHSSVRQVEAMTNINPYCCASWCHVVFNILLTLILTVSDEEMGQTVKKWQG